MRPHRDERQVDLFVEAQQPASSTSARSAEQPSGKIGGLGNLARQLQVKRRRAISCSVCEEYVGSRI